MSKTGGNRRRHPDWIKQTLPGGEVAKKVRKVLAGGELHTICEEARCPNRGECWNDGTATFLILGDACTRNCHYCAVSSSENPEPPDSEEPIRIGEAVSELECSYVVITSVTRDDIPDGGAHHFAETIRSIRHFAPGAQVEVLVPDFSGDRDSLDIIAVARPEVFGHNIETVEKLFSEVRPDANYKQSLAIFEYMWRTHPGIVLKSGLMVGLGETRDDISRALSDLRAAGVSIVTIGQYLQPMKDCVPVERYLPPEEFEEIREEAERIGFSCAICGPMVRSSYRAHEAYAKKMKG